jgi:class 3 adenylate cyclase
MSDYSDLNWDVPHSAPDLFPAFLAANILKNESITTGMESYPTDSTFTKKEHDALHSQINGSDISFPHSFILHPVPKIPGDVNSEIVAYIFGGFAWDFALRFLLPEGVDGIIAEIENSCDQKFSYRLSGQDAFYIGDGAKHETKYDHMKVSRSLLPPNTHPNLTTTPGHCYYSIVSKAYLSTQGKKDFNVHLAHGYLSSLQSIYPSAAFEGAYQTNTPRNFAFVVALTFVLVAVVFFIYDIFVQKRNEKLISSAAKSNAIVSSLFPDNIRDRLIGQNDTTTKKGTPYHLKSFLLDGGGETKGGNGGDGGNKTSKPLADLFLETTIMFADICGFTSWSSAREPSQVFMLLESVYGSFDQLVKRRRVFKVETVGDCYVAVSGLPEPRRDHAIIMARCARDFMITMRSLTKRLEVTLGPDTGELSLRIGIHSGPVTGGVLRGARSRFQLFGDTMNTTARIESTGESGRIHLSQETADLIIKGGKQAWVQRRAQQVTAKGKGTMQTYWLTLTEERKSTNHSSDGRSEKSIRDYSEIDNCVNDFGTESANQSRSSRLINWNVEQLLFLLRQVVSYRNVGSPAQPDMTLVASEPKVSDSICQASTLPLDEVQEIITLPEFDRSVSRKRQDPDTVEISPVVVEQLKMFVTWIASMYRSNPFHNFDHASHVLMSVIKLMSRIVAPSDLLQKTEMQKKSKVAATLHDHTYGITSDPLTQFACAMSALIHDVDHTGIPNAQLVEEKTDIAVRYKERSVAEQNSLDLAWNMLMEPQYNELRATIFTNDCERRRFRQLVVNSVLATDIVDKDLKALRNARWDKAFKPDQESAQDTNTRDAVNRKATIVIEHLIQASDVSHTMQHWHVFRKWNQRLFEEMHAAYRAGRATKDPSEFWYQGEIGFFDFYIIPLAKKLKDCGVFGVSSDEFLNYALKNREEWESRGQEIVAEMVEAVAKNEEKADKELAAKTIVDPNLFEV